MNNKDFISTLSAKLNTDEKDTQKTINTLISELAEVLDEGNQICVQGFGNFEVKKKLERVVINPATKQRMLVPPKLTLAFKASNVLKEKLK